MCIRDSPNAAKGKRYYKQAEQDSPNTNTTTTLTNEQTQHDVLNNNESAKADIYIYICDTLFSKTTTAKMP